jgi:hypothetical protein
MIAYAPEERDQLRELGRRKAEIGALDRQNETARLWKNLNDLRPTRPLVWINEIPWLELAVHAPELRCVCKDPFLALMERNLRRELYQWDHFACDMVVQPVIFCPIAGGPWSVYADYGIQEKTVSIEGAHDVQYVPVIHSMDDAAQIRTPKVWFDREATADRLAALRDIFDGVIEVRRQGITHQWHTPWDQGVHWYGIEQLMMDMYDRPDLVQEVVGRVCRATGEVLDRQQELGMLDVGIGNWRVGSGGLGFTDDLPEHVEGRAVTPADQWGCSNAQIFSEVSPDMHWEFSLKYELPILERFGLTYYGCCEPLHNKIGLMRKIRNLRKISCSPKCDYRIAAEAVGRDYVLSFKPNPAQIAWDEFKPEAVEAYLRESLDQMRGSPVEVIFKDISTVRDDPRRLDQWAAVAMKVVQSV